jgi:hypothetical protein
MVVVPVTRLCKVNLLFITTLAVVVARVHQDHREIPVRQALVPVAMVLLTQLLELHAQEAAVVGVVILLLGALAVAALVETVAPQVLLAQLIPVAVVVALAVTILQLAAQVDQVLC